MLPKSALPVIASVLSKVSFFLAVASLGLALGQSNNVLKYLELNDIGATPAEILLSPDYQTIIEFEGLPVQSASSGRGDQITVEQNESTIRLRANQETVNTDLTVMVGGKTAMFVLRSDPASNTPRRYVVRNSPPPALTSLGYQGIEGKTDVNALEVGTKDLPPGVTLDLSATMDNKGDVALQYTLRNDGEVAIVNEPSRLYVLNEDIKLRHTQSRVPPAGSVNVIQPGESEYGTIIVPNPPNGRLTFLWILVQLGPGGHYAATVDISALLEAPQGTKATLGTPAPTLPADSSQPQTTPQAAAPQPPSEAQAAAPAATTPDTAPLAAAPEPQQGEGVTLYEQADFKGASVLLGAAAPISFFRAEQGQFGAVPDNTVSSLVVPEGYSVMLCDQAATFPCQQFGPGSHTLGADLNDRVSFAQVSLTPLAPETATPAPNPAQEADSTASPLYATFDNDDGSWSAWGGTSRGSVTDGRYCVTVEDSGSRPWDVVAASKTFTLEANRSYELSFTAKAESVNGLIARVAGREEPVVFYLEQELSLDAGEQTFNSTFTMPENRSDIVLWFFLGGELSPAPTTVCFDNISLKEVAPGASTQPEATEQTTRVEPPAQEQTSQTEQSSEAETDDTASQAEPATSSTEKSSSTQESTGAGTVLLETTFDGDEQGWAWRERRDVGAVSEGRVVDGEFCVAIEQSGTETWGIQLEGPRTLNLQQGHTYELTFDARAESVSGVVLRMSDFDPQTPQYIFLDEELSVHSSVQTFQYTLDMPSDGKNMSVGFNFGGKLSSNAPTTVCLDNVRLQDVTQATSSPDESPERTAEAESNLASQAAATPASSLGENLLVNSSFEEAGATNWESNIEAGARGIAKVVNSEYCFNLMNGGYDQWNVSLKQSGFSLEPGQSYVLSFDAHANKARTVIARVGQGYEPWAAHSYNHFDLQQNKQRYALSFVMPDVQDSASQIEIYLGGDLATNTPFQVCFDNVTLQAGSLTPQEASSINTGSILGNGTFTDDLVALWTTYDSDSQNAEAAGAARNGEYCVTITSSGQETWAVQLNQRPFMLGANQDYVLSFEAYADQPYTIKAKIGQGYEPWTAFQQQDFNLGTEKQRHTMPVRLQSLEAKAGLEFWLGGNVGATLPAQVCFDNVTLTNTNVSASQ